MQNKGSHAGRKILVFTGLLCIFSTFPITAVQADAEVPAVDHRFCLTYLLTPEEKTITEEIRQLESRLDSSSGLNETDEFMLRYAAGVLHTYRYIRSEEKTDAMQAREYLESVETRFARDDLFIVHLGMAHAFVASIKKVFGVGNLKKMQTELQSIDRNHPDWLIRFLRGVTSVEVGRALPGVFAIRDIKQEAVEVGADDLRYVLAQSRIAGDGEFDPENYDYAAKPVPLQVAEQAEEVLQED